MKPKWTRVVGILAVGIAIGLTDSFVDVRAQRGSVVVDGDDIGGVVIGPNGPEAGVWVIAETLDLPTRFVRIVVTDDNGRYVVPDLPDAGYDLWVRGYGLVDSPRTRTRPGREVNLTAVPAPTATMAAQYYPAGYWFSLIEVPDVSEFPGTGAEGNGISSALQSQAAWIRSLKSGGCTACHALGNKATREIPPELGDFDSLEPAWDRPDSVGAGGREHEQRAGPDGTLSRTADVCRLDGSDRLGRATACTAAPAGA